MTKVAVQRRSWFCNGRASASNDSSKSVDSASTADTSIESTESDCLVESGNDGAHQGSKRRVHFSPTARQKAVRSHKSLSEQRKRQIWFSSDEFVKVRTDGRQTAIDACTNDIRYKYACDEVCKCLSIITASMEPFVVELLLTDSDFLDTLSENLYESNILEDDKTYRGLEDMISAPRRFIRFDEGRQSRKMVLEAARVANTIWPEEAARQYREMSLASVFFARVAAVADAAAAEDVYEDIAACC